MSLSSIFTFEPSRDMSTHLDPGHAADEYSAGGILVRAAAPGPLACLVSIPTRGGNASWRLPKGTLEPGETSREAALREVREESGCQGEIIAELTPIEYWYTRRDEASGEKIRVRKEVDFYLMRYVAGNVQDHDDEVDEARWFPFAEALQAISYDAERQVLQEAIHSWDAYIYRQSFEQQDIEPAG